MTSTRATLSSIESITFIRNFAHYDGGGVILLNSSLIQIGRPLNFTGNLAGNGGAISSHQSHVSLNGFATFEQNSAKGLGGAVYIMSGTWSSAVISFVGNSAESGGAVYAADSNLKFGNFSHTETPIITPSWRSLDTHCSSLFSNNSATANGGAIATETSVIMMISYKIQLEKGNSTSYRNHSSGKVGFYGNTALNDGGGICLGNFSTLNISGTGTYLGNVAGNVGGMINAYTYSSVVLDGGNVFTGNYALWGGAIALSEQACSSTCLSCAWKPSSGSMAVILGKISLLYNGAEHDGGGIYLSLSTVEVFGNITYDSNTAGIAGGGIHGYESTLKTSGMEVYINNVAQTGGGVYVYCSNVTMSGTGSYINNWGVDGGAIMQYSHIEFKGEVFFIKNQARSSGGGVLLEWDTTLNVTGIGTYIGNTAKKGGGGTISVNYDGLFVLDGESWFTGNYAGNGGGIGISSGTGLMLGKTSMVSNQAKVNGGGICQGNRIIRDTTNLRISGTGSFINNTAGISGGAIAVALGSTAMDSESTFFANSAIYGAAIAVTNESAINISGTIKTYRNRATVGGVIYLNTSSLNVAGNASYLENVAKQLGGVIDGTNSDISLDGKSVMTKNIAGKHGGAISVTRSQLRISSYTERSELVEGSPWNKTDFVFKENEADSSGGVVYSMDSVLELWGETNFVSNVARVGNGGAIHAIRSSIQLDGLHNFTNNSASHGGGLAFESYVPNQFLRVSMIQSTIIHFTENYARYGGAIFVVDIADYSCTPSEIIPERMCFMNLGTTSAPPLVRLPYGGYRNISECIGHSVFAGNMADEGGKNIFGGSLYDCRVEFKSEDLCEYTRCMDQTCYMSGIEAVAALTNLSVEDLTSDPFNIMSDTYKVCPCDFEKPNCKQRNSNYTIYPGETVLISVNVVGRVDGIASVANVIHALISESKGVWLDKRQDTQAIDADCTFLEYTLFSSDVQSARLTLSVEGPCQAPALPYYIYVRFRVCPFGFFAPFASCICERRLQKYTNSCDINTRTITHKGDFWVGFDRHSPGLILHPHCAFDYCKLETVSFTLNSTDLQCVHGRSGILCGACKSGYSLKLGSSRCSSCSNVFLLLFIPFAIAGFLLVVLLFICKVTVAAGTTSGLILYANILAVNKSVFFPAIKTNILTVFKAWLNLDLGIETCFVDGMDMYTRTWLQFAFPLYIWLLVGIIVFVSRHSSFISRIIGTTNPVSVLATLFLLSYTKLLRTIIATLSFTTLDYPDDKSVTVWVYDGNIEYFKGKHIPLFFAGLLAFLLLFLPYTLLLLFGQATTPKSNTSWMPTMHHTEINIATGLDCSC